MRRTVKRMAGQECGLLAESHQLWGKRDLQFSTVRQHKVIQPVADTDALYRFMGADIAPSGLIYLPFFDIDNVAQYLQSCRDTVIPGQHLFPVFLLCGRRFGSTVQPGGFVILTGLKGLL